MTFAWTFLLLLGLVMIMIKETLAAIAFIGSGLFWLTVELCNPTRRRGKEGE